MSKPWAEVIGDPVSHSLSPAIHAHWLRALGIDGDYRATLVPRESLQAFLASRRADAPWRGCNVTAPHKECVEPLLHRVDADAGAVGAVNCIYRDGSTLAGANTDIDGIDEALAGVDPAGRSVAVIGGGGAARAAIHWARKRGAQIVLIARRPQAGADLPVSRALSFETADAAIRAAHLIVNATPLGLEGGAPMPPTILRALAHCEGTAAFDMIYRPLDTPFLVAARAGGLRAIDGLSMLIGQARRSFSLLFGTAPPPREDLRLRTALNGLLDSRQSGLTGTGGED